MATPSVTPKAERRNRIIRQSISSQAPFLSSDQKCDEAQTERRGVVPRMGEHQQQDSREEHNETAAASPAALPAALYHQICVQPPESFGGNAMSWTRSLQPAAGAFGCDQATAAAAAMFEESRKTPLLHKVQLLHGLEVLCKRLLFHLVKTSAGAPKCFSVLPFILLGTTLMLCSLSSNWPKGPLRFLFPFDSLHFGHDPNGGCFLTRLAGHSGADHFPEDNLAFDALQRNSPTEFAILLSTWDPMDSVLPANGTATLAFAELFRQIQDMNVQHHRHVYKWWDLCRQCGMDTVVEHLLRNDLDLQFPEASIKGSGSVMGNDSLEGDNRTAMAQRKLFLAGTIGDVELNSADGTLRRAHSLLMRVKLRSQLRPALVDAFERRLRRIVSNFTRVHANEEAPIQIHFWSSQRLSDEMEEALKGAHGRLALSWLMLAALLALSQCRSSTYESRPFLGLQQAIALLLSTFCAFAVHLASAGRLNSLLVPLPYTIAAIGVLGFAAIDGAFERYSGIAMHPTEKMAFIFIWDGPCLVLSLLWLLLLCLISSFLVHSVFLLQFLLALGAALVSLLLFTLTFLLVCWLATARRIAAGLKWFQLCRSGDQAFNEKQMFDYDAHTCARLHEKLADLRPCFARRVGQLVCATNFRMVAFALFCVGCIGAVLAGLVANTRVVLEPTQFVSPRGQSRAFQEHFRLAFPKYEDYLQLYFDGLIDYEERKEQIFALLNWAVERELASRSISWLLEFDKFKKSVAYHVDEDSTIPLLTHLFLQNGLFRKFTADLRISQGQIHGSRMYLELTAKGREQSEFLIRSLLERAQRLGLPLFLEAPFSFSLGHDIQVMPQLLSALFWLCSLSALFSIFQPALAICLFASNLFLVAVTNALCSTIGVPLNIFTMGTLLAFGIPLNSACLLHFAHHFFNAGPRQQSNRLRIQYAFQCTLKPIFLACIVAPLCFSAQFLLGPCPPIIAALGKVLAACSLVIFGQTIIFLPSLLALCADLFHNVFTIASQLCDENANAEMTVDPMAENVYFVSNNTRQMANNFWPPIGSALGFGPHVVYPLEPYQLEPPLCVPPAYQPPPIDFPRKSPAQFAIQNHSRQHSQQGMSPRLGNGRSGDGCGSGQLERRSVAGIGAVAPPIYSPPNRRRENQQLIGDGSKTDSGNNSFSESLESRADLRIHQRRSRSQPPLPNPMAVSNNNAAVPFQPSVSQQNRLRGRPDRHGFNTARDEQIYEEPDSAETNGQQRESAIQYRKSKAACSPSYRRKFQV